MRDEPQHEVTRLLEEAQSGRKEAVGELFDLVYDELHAVAERRMRQEKSGNLLQPTALVNETYLRLFGDEPAPITGRQHFFGVAASAMRRILIDMSRAEKAEKRGGRPVQVDLEDWMQITDDAPELQIDLQNGLDALAALDARAAQVMEMVIYGGRSATEVADLLQMNRRTVERDIASARLFLKRYLSTDATHS